eukprot:TRINITY_DN2721_c0_g1_i8.p1 TRINITY_DN2721_c0_g1~~TRINITY_DN2721_c0_g1_i8.p1  ORF type:complete len:101 (-),score=10.03 TRINITY_DN2721_c0_g1_i8:1676-1978(-)
MTFQRAFSNFSPSNLLHSGCVTYHTSPIAITFQRKRFNKSHLTTAFLSVSFSCISLQALPDLHILMAGQNKRAFQTTTYDPLFFHSSSVGDDLALAHSVQ